MDRQARHGEVAFLLEPELKEGRGGLRDVQALRWAHAARPILDTADVADLASAERVLFGTRVALHLVTGRAGDRLLLQDQDAVAARLDTDADGLMGDVASAGRRVAWVADEVWARVAASASAGRPLLGWRSRSQAPGVVVRSGSVELEPTVDPAQRPELVFVAADVARRTGARLGRPLLQRLVERTPMPDEPWDDGLRARFLDLLAGGHAAVPVIEALDHVGLWARYLTEWSAIRSRPQRNAYHRFTVDRHLLETVANAAASADRVARPDLLLLGALFHDIAKGRPGDHAIVGIEVADAAMIRMGVAPDDRAVVATLIRHHLLLAEVATRRDLTDPAAVDVGAAAVGPPEVLHLLAALTEAASIATGPSAWGHWSAALVAELVHRTEHRLAGGDPTVLTLARFPDDRHRELADAGETVVLVDDEFVTVVAPDRPGLLSQVTGALALQGLSVRSADATTIGAMAVDRFRVVAAPGSVPDPARTIARVEAAVGNRLAIEARLADRARTYRVKVRQAGLPPATVRFDDHASGATTVVEVQAPDALGLLHRLARAFSEFELDVAVVKAQTVGGIVIDAFYVTGLADDPDLRAELEVALLHAVG